VPRSDSLRRRGRLNALKRHRAAGDPDIAEAARELAAARAEEYLRAAVAASRAAQGLPPVVVDPAALERAAAALRLAIPVARKKPVAPAQRNRRRKAVSGEASPA
jgi:hypothetical protein